MNLEITATNSDKDKIRSEYMKTEKLKEQTIDKLQKVHEESQLFYKRA